MVAKLIVLLQNRADLIDQYVDEYPSWESKRKAVISSLESIAADLNKSVEVADSVKIGAASAAVTGGIAMVAGALLLPFTFGASSPLIAGGAAAAIGGGVTMGVADLTKYGITKSRCKSIDEMVKGDSDSTNCIASILTQIQRLSEVISSLLDELRIGPIDDDKIQQMQALGGVALACGNTWIGRNLIGIYYSVAAKMLPAGYRTEQLTPRAFANYSVTVMEDQLVMPPTTLILRFQSEAEVGEETEVVEEGGEEAVEAEEAEEAEMLAELEALEIEEELEIEELESAELLEVEAEEAEELEMLETLEMEELAEIEGMGALGVGVAVAEILLPATIIVGFAVYELVKTIKEIEHGSKVANSIEDVAEKLSKYTAGAAMIYNKLKRYKRPKQEKEKKKTKYLLSMVSASTFNIKGTIQNDEFKSFLMKAFSMLRSNLYHIQECIWSETGVWVKKNILPPADYKIRISPSGDAGIASHTRFLKELGPPSGMVSSFLTSVLKSFASRAYCLKFSTNITYEVIKPEWVVTRSSKTLKFLSFSFHGYHKKSPEFKTLYIKRFIEFVGKCCRAEKLPAIVGGDFNYDIRKINWERRHRIKIFGGTSNSHRSIDFLCTVYENAFETRMAMIPFVGFIDINEFVPPKLHGKTTNHVPYFGTFCLYKELSDNN